jgi:hypothetical protein
VQETTNLERCYRRSGEPEGALTARQSSYLGGTRGRQTWRLEASLSGRMFNANRNRGPAHGRYWLIVRREQYAQEPLVLNRTDDQLTLPLFGREEEALNFLRYRDIGDNWWVRETSAREIVTWLFDRCAQVC